MREYRFVTTGTLGLVLALVSGCSNQKPEFSDLDAATTGDAQVARAPADRTENAPDPSADAGHVAPDPVRLPADVSLDPSGVVLCGHAPCECNNGIDDDGDGTVDGFDVECTGAIDNDESSFATGIPGDNRDPKWQDCFFDGNSGAGDDRCRYPTECLTGELSLDDDACAVTQACRDNCQPRTPQGCDCFGCCAVALPGGSPIHVTLSSSCSAEKLGDPEACPPCNPNPSCGHQPTPGAPSDPDAPGAGPDAGAPAPTPVGTCEERAECSEFVDCPLGQFCSLGCCLLVIH